MPVKDRVMVKSQESKIISTKASTPIPELTVSVIDFTISSCHSRIG
jgi:hypothetical protein